ncbi:hypothetical protein [Streptomyces vastus]|uniref:hypothetical protein n=1 Tax=Streptomyces vastus TaxID=285451 RepID=UPI0031DF4C24
MQLGAAVASVVADAEPESVEDLALEGIRKSGESEAKLRDHFEERGIAGLIRCCFCAKGLQLSEGRATLVLKGVEAFPDALAELRSRFRVSPVFVGGGQLVEQELLAARETVRLVLETLDVG